VEKCKSLHPCPACGTSMIRSGIHPPPGIEFCSICLLKIRSVATMKWKNSKYFKQEVALEKKKREFHRREYENFKGRFHAD
jgi:hypothetical protein